MSNDIVTTDKQLDVATKAILAIDKAEDRSENLTPVAIVEHSVADFLGKAMDAAVRSEKLATALEDSLIADLPEMSTTEKITLYNIERSAANDNKFKLLSPSIGLLTARQQAIIQAASKEAQQAAVQVNVNSAGNPRDEAVSSSASPEVISGLNTLFQLMANRAKTTSDEVTIKTDSSEN